ncbi:MAG: LysM peptidoglycan-binding domain-containing protein [Sphingorhabdus sp.]
MNASAAAIDRTSNFQPANRGNPTATDYPIGRGDTLGEIAARFGTDVDTLARMNGITDPNRIYAGQMLKVPGNRQSHPVERGDTLSEIAAMNGTSVDALMRANPEIRNADQIYPGQVIRISREEGVSLLYAPKAPSRSSTPESVSGVESTSMQNGRLSLSQTDINNIKKTLQTEWVQSSGDAQARGIVDTILNRTASGRWGQSVADVVNARNQFSDINGPPARRKGRDSVEDYPMAQVSRRVSDFVDAYLAQRANGTPSSIGSHLNYANPHYSDRQNLGWIMALDGPVLGRGDAVHRHGTTPDLEHYRPGAFSVVLP